MSLALRVAQGPLSPEAMARAMEQIMAGELPPEEVAGFLKGLAARGESAEEIAAGVGVLRRHATSLPLRPGLELCDTCGTGGDGQGTLNVSTLAALVAAGCGVRVAKHGNRAASSRCGSADVLAALGVNLEAPPATVARCIEEIGFGFCFAPLFHPAMKAVAPVRKALGIRTIFNLIGPLANPAPLAFQLVGVADPGMMEPVALALRALGVRRGLVAHGAGGLDEVSTTGPTRVLELRDGHLLGREITPDEVGLRRATLDELRGGDASRNAALAQAILRNEPSAGRDIVALNAGCAVYVAGRAGTIAEGTRQAEAALADGRALRVLERLVSITRG
jgi:anthranilate phosphoribosyltransferase